MPRPERDDRVVLAYVHQDEVTHSFSTSLLRLYGHEENLITSEALKVNCEADGLGEARNVIARAFLEREEPWLFIADTDMGIPPTAIADLRSVADPEQAPIVGGLCFSWRKIGPDGMGGFHYRPTPTIFDWIEQEGVSSFGIVPSYPVNSLVRCAATGSACILIHRTVFETIREKYGEAWYDRLNNQKTGQLLGEDLSFCIRVAASGFPLHVHTGVKTSHKKPIYVSESVFWDSLTAPPAETTVDVIVPVLGRPQNAKPFMASLRSSTGLARVHVVANISDRETRSAWEDAGADRVYPVDDDARSFPAKANLGYRYSQEDRKVRTVEPSPWIFLVGDDVRFHPGWFDHAIYAATAHGGSVVGTNDLGNQRVMAGMHSTHLLISREYVDRVGASWDGPGVLCHEGYRHWYVDDEIVTAAKQRGEWQMALGSIVEHLHPFWGKAPDDEVYREGGRGREADGALFKRRLQTSIAALDNPEQPSPLLVVEAPPA